MALQPCRECTKPVSTAAATCPHCGVSKPVPATAGNPAVAIGCFVLMVLGFLFFLGSMCEGNSGGGSRAAADITPASPSVGRCNEEQKAESQVALSRMRGSPMLQSETIDAGWRVVTFGQDYFSWTSQQAEAMVTAYANFDACITGAARNLEFRSPSGKLVARADRLRGIQMK